MKKKRLGSLTGLGIGLVVVLVIIMMIKSYLKLVDEPIHIRLLDGIVRFLAAFFGSGLVFIVVFLVMYGAIHLSIDVFNQGDTSSDELLEHFKELTNPIFIICFIAAYVVAFFSP